MPEIQERVQRVFEDARDQKEALRGIYRLFIPDWTSNSSRVGWPSCGNGLYRLITSLFCVFDFENHPDLPTGKLWRDEGFLRDVSLGNWEVSLRSSREEKDLCFE